MFQVKTPALVLDKRLLYKDEGNITLFTKSFGILRVAAAGVERQGAGLAAWTDPPASVTADITVHEEKSSGYGRLLTLSLRNYFPHIRSSYHDLSWFYFYCFILMHFLPCGVKSEKAYRLLRDVLKSQDSWGSGGKRDFGFAYFLVRFLKIEGLCAGFDRCVSCRKQFAVGETAYYLLNEQGLFCGGCSRKITRDSQKFATDSVSLDFLKLLPALYRTGTGPEAKILNLPEGLLRVNFEEREVLKIQQNSEQVESAFANINSYPKINDQTLAKVRNFLLIFLAPLL